MNFESTVKLLKLRVPRVVRFACLYLEQRGLRFCVDFGTDNAVSKAAEIESKRILI